MTLLSIFARTLLHEETHARALHFRHSKFSFRSRCYLLSWLFSCSKITARSWHIKVSFCKDGQFISPNLTFLIQDNDWTVHILDSQEARFLARSLQSHLFFHKIGRHYGESAALVWCNHICTSFDDIVLCRRSSLQFLFCLTNDIDCFILCHCTICLFCFHLFQVITNLFILNNYYSS